MKLRFNLTQDFPFIVVGALLIFSANSCRDNGGPCTTCPPTEPDTTGHNFTWTIDTLGDGNGSALYDVAIVNDTLAYAVGEIYLKDSTGQIDQAAYNFIQWNGKTWQAMRARFSCDGSQGTPFATRAIFSFGAADVWFCSAGLFGRWNGQTFSFMCPPGSVFTGSVNKLWGSSATNLYAVGTGGLVAHFDGSSWTKIESGTSLSVNDIWGAGVNGQTEILALASDQFQGQGRKLLRIEGSSISSANDSGLPSWLSAVWFVPNSLYWVVGDGIWEKHSLSSMLPWSVYPKGAINNYYSGGVRGNAANDVFVVGSALEVVHFNGSSWHNYRDVIPWTSGAFGRVAVKNNLAIAVGSQGPKAIAAIGKRVL